ncbi:hypothetical protein HRbin15_00893 [bacterium HR15]|nr:hypothetical protein HRbin15_00893 [bacterium HR15]
MERIHLDPGIYLNIFPVSIPEEPILLMRADRSLFQDLRSLRQDLEQKRIQAWVYPEDNCLYGYGPNASDLETFGFQQAQLRLSEVPKLASRLIIEGLLNQFRSEGFSVLPYKGRWRVHPNQCSEVADGQVRVYQGYDLRVFYWRSSSSKLAFGLIVDIDWALRDHEDRPFSLQEIRKQYGSKTIIAIGQVQGEYLPDSSKINTEVARQRFQEHILPFVRKYSSFDLPCGKEANLSPEPVRVVLEGDER